VDVVLGVAVADRIARLTLVEAAAQGQDVIDQSVVDLADNPIQTLTDTVVGTNRLLADENHRLSATRLWWSDPQRVDELRRALEDSGVQNVVVLDESEAATAMAPAVGLDGDATAVAPTVALDGEATAMAPAAALASPDATAMAPAVGPAGDATTIAPTAGLAESRAEEPQLAYSMTDDGEPLPVEGEFGPDFHEYYDDEEAQTTAQRLSGRSLLISNAVVAFAVIGFASLAVAVAVTVRPTAAAEPVVGHQNAAPGKFMPLLPTQQQAPVPAPPADQPNAGYQGGIIPDTNGYIPPQLISPGEGPAPVPASPGTPGLVPNPNGPIPIPIIVPFPGWRPGYPPNRPPIGPTSTYLTPPSITPPTPPSTPPSYPPSTPVTPSTPSTPSAPSTPSTPSTPSAPSTPSTPSAPSSAPSTPSSAPPPSSKAPYISSQPPPSVAPPSTQHTAAPPHVQTQQTVAPKPANPQPATPPHSGHH